MSSLSLVFFIDDVSCSKSPVISICCQETVNTHSLLKSPKQSEANSQERFSEDIMFILSKDAKINVIDGHTGKSISSRPWNMKKELVAISMYVIGKYIFLLQKNKILIIIIWFHSRSKFWNFWITEGNTSSSKLCNENQPKDSFKDTAAKNEPIPDNSEVGTNSHEVEHDSCPETAYSGENLLELFVLLCCEDSLRLYSTKSVIQVSLDFFNFTCNINIFFICLRWFDLLREMTNPYIKWNMKNHVVGLQLLRKMEKLRD